MSGLGEKDMERNMIKRESSWYRRLGVGALQSGISRFVYWFLFSLLLDLASLSHFSFVK